MGKDGSYRCLYKNLSYEQLTERIKDIQKHGVKVIQTTQPIEELLYSLNGKAGPEMHGSPSLEISADDVSDLEDSSLAVDVTSNFLDHQAEQLG